MIFRSGSTTTCGPASQASLAFAGAACARCGRSKRFNASNTWKQSLHPMGWSAKVARNQSTNTSWGFRQPTQHGLPAADALSLCRAFSNHLATASVSLLRYRARARRDTRRRDHGRPVVAALLAATQRSAVQFFERLHRASSYRRRESASVPSGTPESLR